MASELLKNRALIQRLKEPEVPKVNFDLASTGFEELFTLPEPKPQELLDIQENVRIQRQQDTMNKARPFLMDESVDFIERQNFAEGTFSFGNQKFSVEIPNLTSTQIKAYQKGFKDLEKWLKDPAPENWIETFRTPSKKGQTHQSEFSLNLRKYIQGQPINARAQKIFDTVNIRNLLSDKANEIQTYTPQEFRRVSNLPKSKKAAEVALNKSMKAASAVRDVFVGDPDADLEDVARGIFGKDFDKADLVVKEDMLSKASDDTAKFLEAITANRKVKGFKPISADKLQDIIGNIEDNTKDFKFREGTIREYRFRIRDSLLGIETESAEGFRNLRNVVGGTDKGKVVDEVFGLSATFKNAPGYVENVQLIDKKINNIKGKQIDKPFAAIVNAVKNKKNVVQYEGQEMDISKAIQKFNQKSQQFSKKNKISTPQIFVGDNLDPTKLVSNFKQYSPQAQLDIIEQATNDGFVLNATKPSTPARGFIKKTGRADLIKPGKGTRFNVGVPVDEYIKGITEDIKAGKKGKAALKTLGPLGIGATGYFAQDEFRKGEPALDIGVSAVTGIKPTESLLRKIVPEEKGGYTDKEKLARAQLQLLKATEDYKPTSLDFGRIGTVAAKDPEYEGAPGLYLDYLRDKQDEVESIALPAEERFQKEIMQPFFERKSQERSAITEGLGNLIDYIKTQSFPGQIERMDFADGSDPKNPGRRAFLKLMGGIASLPVVGKLFKGGAPIVEKLANTTTKMPEWFPDFVDRFIGRSVGKKIDADIMEYKNTELPGVTLIKGDDGQIVVEGRNAYDEPYEIVYRPPGYELVDEKTGKAVKTPGEFIASDTQFRRTGPEIDDYDVDGVVVNDVDDILGGNATELEGFAKGTGKSKYTRGQKEIDMADAQGTRADVDEGPDIDMSDYED